MSADVCVEEEEVHSASGAHVGLFLQEADEEDDLNHHRNSLIKSDPITATLVPLMPQWLLHDFLSGLTSSIYTTLRGRARLALDLHS